MTGISLTSQYPSLFAQRALSSASKTVDESMQRLASGVRINSAMDDPAGLMLADKFGASARAAQFGIQNAQMGMNLMAVADNDLGLINEQLQRVRDLAVQACSSTYSSSERTAIESEIAERVSEITRISDGSKFNKTTLLDGSNTTISIYLDDNAIDFAGGVFTDADATALSVNALAVSTVATATTAVGTIDSAIEAVNTRRAKLGAYMGQLDSAISSLGARQEAMLASESTIRDTDIAAESARMTQGQILQQAATAMIAQANSRPALALQLMG